MSPTSIFASASTPADVGALALVIASAGAGWLVGGPESDDRKTLALTTAGRNVGVSLVIATGSFPGTPAITAATAYALFQTVVMALVALGWGRLSSATGSIAQRARA
jgi:BASS family bile acid:Na+ symporter